MTLAPDQLLSALKRVGLSQRKGAKFLGMNERTMRKIVAGEAHLSKPAAMLLRLMIRHKLSPDAVEAMLPKEKKS